MYCLITQDYPFYIFANMLSFPTSMEMPDFFLALLLFYSTTTDNLNHRSSRIIVPRAQLLNYLPALTEAQTSCWCCSTSSSSSSTVSSLDVLSIRLSYWPCVAQRAYAGVVGEVWSCGNKSCVCHTHRVLEHVEAGSKTDSFKLNLAFQA